MTCRILEGLGSPEALAQSFQPGSREADLFTRPFLSLNLISEAYTAQIAMALVQDLGWEEALRRGASLDELLEGLKPPSRHPAQWLLDFLVRWGDLQRQGHRYFLHGTPRLETSELRALLEAEAPGHSRNLDLLDALRSHVKPYFTEGRSGESCLFDLAVFPLWLDYFRNENLIYRSNNVYALDALLSGLQENSRVLELGGGAGSFSQLLTQEAVARSTTDPGILQRIVDYRFTDLAPTFLRRAQRGLKELAPGLPLSFASLDINRSLDAQGLEDQRFEIIVGINVLHVARDLQATLRDLRQHLAPGGRLIIGECLKPDLEIPIYQEFFFEFMASFTDVQTDPILRPRHGFLTPEAWLASLRAAGFTDIQEFPVARPMMDRYPDFNVGAFAAR